MAKKPMQETYARNREIYVLKKYVDFRQKRRSFHGYLFFRSNAGIILLRNTRIGVILRQKL